MNHSDTPKTDAAEYQLISNVRPAMVVDAKAMRQLERELNALREITRSISQCSKRPKNTKLVKT